MKHPSNLYRPEKDAHDQTLLETVSMRSRDLSQAGSRLDIAYSNERLTVIEGIAKAPEPVEQAPRAEATVPAPQVITNEIPQDEQSIDFLDPEAALAQVNYIHYLAESGQNHGITA
jgi:hypothetical protein